jgi:hypothetical protein
VSAIATFITALFKPPVEKKTKTARDALDIFWSNGLDALNFFQELVAQIRIGDAWYNTLLVVYRADASPLAFYAETKLYIKKTHDFEHPYRVPTST